MWESPCVKTWQLVQQKILLLHAVFASKLLKQLKIVSTPLKGMPPVPKKKELRLISR